MTDWEEAALDSIASSGLGSLSIPALARALGVTKGSFYWHFTGLDALVGQALSRWESMDRQTLRELEVISDPLTRLNAAFTEALQQDRAHALYVALAASDDPRVTAALNVISERRLRFLAAAYADLGLEESEAHEQAMLAYTAYIGLLHLRKQSFPRLRSAAALGKFVTHAVAALIPAKPKGRKN